MQTLTSRSRVRRSVAAGILTSIAAVGGLIAYISASGAVETARTMITLEKQCQAAPNGSPIFVVRNVSDSSATPQTITVAIYDRYFTSNASAKVVDGIVLTAGETKTITAPAGWPLVSAYGPDHQYYAHFSAVVHVEAKGKVAAHDELQVLKTHEFCVCGQSPDTTSTTTTTIRF